MERVFMLNSGVEGFIRPYWELLASETDPLMERVRRGEIEKAGIVVAFPPLPYAWAAGRFFALFPNGDGGFEWKEVTGQVQHDIERGIEECPEWLRTRYRAVLGVV